MGTFDIGQAFREQIPAGEISMPLVANLPDKFDINPLRRSNRVNIRLRDEDIDRLEKMALAANMPFQAFLSDLVHKYAAGDLPGQNAAENAEHIESINEIENLTADRLSTNRLRSKEAMNEAGQPVRIYHY